MSKMGPAKRFGFHGTTETFGLVFSHDSLTPREIFAENSAQSTTGFSCLGVHPGIGLD